MVELDITDVGGSLHITATWQRDLIDRLMSGLLAGGIVLVGASATIGLGTSVILGAAAIALVAFAYVGRTQKFHLTVTHAELQPGQSGR